jgi:hypothetical protein
VPALRRLGYAVVLGERQRWRFLQRHVLAGLKRGDGLFGVQVMRRQDLDGVDGGIGEQVVELLIGRAGPLGTAALAGAGIDVANGDDFAG